MQLNYNLDKLEILKRRIIKKILGLRKTSEGWKLRSNDEIYQSIDNITETMRKRRLLFFGHLYRICLLYTSFIELLRVNCSFLLQRSLTCLLYTSRCV